MLCRPERQAGDRDRLGRVRSQSVLGMVGLIFISHGMKLFTGRRSERHVGMAGCTVLQTLEVRCANQCSQHHLKQSMMPAVLKPWKHTLRSENIWM